MRPRALRSTPLFRQVVFAACLCSFVSAGALAQSKIYRPPPRYVQLGKPDQAEGRRILDDFRERSTIAGDYYLTFDLRVLPRRGEERTVHGQLWGSRNDRGPVSRVVLSPGEPQAAQRLLVQNGRESGIWNWQAGQATPVAPSGVQTVFEPLAGTDVTAFDLQMPFLYWDDFVFEGVARVRGRPAHVFLMYPPAEVSAVRPELTGVRIYLDTQFNALVKAEQIAPGDTLVKSITGGDLKKVDEQWIPKWIEVRDEKTRNKTRFAVTGVALGLDFSRALFSSEMLPEPVAAPQPERMRVISP